MSKTSYILGKRINRGGMAEIYLGKALGEDNFERICAIKRILPHYACDKEYVKMFRDEAHICKRLQHANIVQVYDFSEVEESFALIMEFIDGADLRTLLATCETLKIKLPLQMCIYIAACAARGLHYAHTKTDEITGKPLEIIHRDISPQNILISYEGEVKVTDFGIASATAENKSAETKAGVVKGKYSYMSPEQVAAKKLDGRSDVFSLAVVFWELVAMRRLFACANEVETIRKVQECVIPNNLMELNNEVDERLAEIIHKGLHADRRKRYQTGAAFDQDLSKYLHTRYPDFGASELGDFLKQKLASRRMETADFIKQTLAISSADVVSRATREGHADPAGTSSALVKLELSAIDRVAAQGTFSKKNTSMDLSNATGRRSPGRNSVAGSMTLRGTGTRKLNTRTFSRKHLVPTIIRRALWAAAMVLVGVGAFEVHKKYMHNEKFMHIELRAEPSVVQLNLDKHKVNYGAYYTTPLRLPLTPGHHTLVVNHPGYVPYIVEFTGDVGDVLPVDSNMQRKIEPGVFSVKIKSGAPQPYQVNVNRGFKQAKTPFLVDDVALGDVMELCYWEDAGKEENEKSVSRCTKPFNPKDSNKKTHRCTVRAPASKPPNEIFTVTIKPHTGKGNDCKTSFE